MRLLKVTGALLACGTSIAPLSVKADGDKALPSPTTLAKRVYGLEGTPSIVRFASVAYAPITHALIFNVDGTAGAQYQTYFLWHPKKKDDGQSVSIQIHSGRDFELLKDLKTQLIFGDPASITAKGNLRWLAIGDSLTLPAFYIEQTIQTLQKALPDIRLQPVGTMHPEGKADLRHEGRGGWTWERYYSASTSNPATSSPFVFQSGNEKTFDFARYLQTHHNNQAPEIITVFLGANDVYGSSAKFDQSRITASLNTAVEMVSKIRQAAPNSVIGIIPPPPPSEQNGFAVNYQNGVTEWQYRRAMQFYIAGLLEHFDGRWDERIYIVPGYLGFDPATSYPVAANDRAQNALHPHAEGFKAISSSLSAWIVSLLSNQAVKPQP